MSSKPLTAREARTYWMIKSHLEQTGDLSRLFVEVEDERLAQSLRAMCACAATATERLAALGLCEIPPKEAIH